MWQQVYDPFGNPVLSTIAAAIPVAAATAGVEVRDMGHSFDLLRGATPLIGGCHLYVTLNILNGR